MTSDQMELLRRLALNDRTTVNSVMAGDHMNIDPLEPRQAALVRIAVLLGTETDPATYRWAAELALAAGVEDADVCRVVLLVAPIIGTARLTAVLPPLVEAFDLDLVEE